MCQPGPYSCVPLLERDVHVHGSSGVMTLHARMELIHYATNANLMLKMRQDDESSHRYAVASCHLHGICPAVA